MNISYSATRRLTDRSVAETTDERFTARGDGR
ncbi:hypothetical protein ZOD2009_17413 [Haladaptatus paucihalophilus DX253]|uniref:Uncharacterized protein n=1 Tax=Haladaptatus paucihalophilus DX253 TaxID=797209 RepID=E7QXE4_HALPU|nr:hypothetical protein ZOD2009_17413 [Haladaptatus paucihalophilus DX253]